MRVAEFAPVAASLNALQNVTWGASGLEGLQPMPNR
jgi:hypothetical protein